MARKTPIPSYRRQKKEDGNDRAFVVISGERRYLGDYGSPESKDRYARIIAEWRATGDITPSDPSLLTVNELLAQFWTRRIEGYYTNSDGSPSNEITEFSLSLTPVRQLYGGTLAKDFGPKALMVCRQWFIDRKLSRKVINKRVGRIKLMVRWSVGEELLPADAYYRVQAIPGLRQGRTAAREAPGLFAVSDDVIEKTIEHLSPVVSAMVRLQRLTGMRTGELCTMRTSDLDTSGKVWTYTPQHHKGTHIGRARTVFIGPKAIAVLEPWLRANLSEYIFQPSDAEAWLRRKRREERTTPEGYGHGPGDNRKKKPMRRPGNRYVPVVYSRAVSRACDKAFPAPQGMAGDALKEWRKQHRWRPYSLRHSFATEIRRTHGLTEAQVLLGHSEIGTTQIYAEADRATAVAVIRKVG